MKLHPLALALGLTPLVGCGGSSSVATPEYSVRAVDGYLRNAQVWLDINGNFKLDDTEPHTLSGDGGVAVLDTTNISNPQQYSVIVKAIASQTIDEDTITKTNPKGIATTTPFLLSAPAGQTVITPLSTLVNIKMKNGMDQQQATADVATDLGIPQADLLGDYIAEENGDIAAKANAIVELNVLPESASQMQEMNQDNRGLDEQLAGHLQVIQSLTEEQRLVKEEDGTVSVATNADSDDDGVIDERDAFPNDASEWSDSDSDAVGDNADAFPNDATETLDTDKDGTGNNADTDDDGDGVADAKDAFPLDATETLDTDKDGTGNNADTDDDGDGVADTEDTFPLNNAETVDSDGDGVGNNADQFAHDASEWMDSDQDGTGDNSDAYVNNAEKSVLDISTTITYTSPVVSVVYQTPLLLDVEQSTSIETFNNGDQYTERTTTYTSKNAVVYGRTTESDHLKSDGSFTRISSWSHDFNLDGKSLFSGKMLDIGNRTADGETYWRYIDENDANVEGGDNGPDPRIFDNADFSARSHLNDLSEIDIIQQGTVSWVKSTEGKTITSDLKQYQVKDFDISATDALAADYAQHVVTEMVGNKIKSIDDQRDWGADGTINQSSQLTITSANSYTFAMQRPVWANPTDGSDEEYADFNFAPGKTDTLTSYWYETIESLDAQGVRHSAGKRFVLNQLNEANVKQLDADNPDGLLFQEYQSQKTPVSDIESNESVTWTHYPLADYEFTVAAKDPGQAYKIYQKQSNGIWVGYSFPEWGSQSIVDLAGQIEDARSAGTPLANIDNQLIPGLSASNLRVTTQSFIYDEQGNARTWYFVSNNPIVTDGQYAISEITLTDNGFKDGWLVLNGPDNFFLAEPTSDAPWNWFDAYQRYWLGISAINTAANNFMWSNWLGEFYLSESQAQARLAELQTLPNSFTQQWLNGKTLYAVWFGDGDLADADGNALDENGVLVPEGSESIELTDVAVVQEMTFNSDGTLTVKGVKNAVSIPDGVPYHYLVDDSNVLRIPEEQDGASEGNIICDNSNPDYLKTHFVTSDDNGVEQFDNVDLFFFEKQKALDFANGLSASIPACTNAL